MDKKRTGSYYTPIELVKAMLKYVSVNENTNILEPSVGDGRIVKEINNKYEFNKIDCVEISTEKVDKLIDELDEVKNLSIFNDDFLDYSIKSYNKNYDLIIGNPPYINKKSLTKKQIEKAESLYSEFGLESKSFKNLWTVFILASIKLLKTSGIIFFVLPYEFLQVDYSIAIRNLLEKRFNNIKIFVFKNKIFKDIQQDVCLLYLSNKKSIPYIEYNLIEKFNLDKPLSSNKILKNKPLEKWTNSIVSDSEIELLKKLSKNCISFKEIGRMSPGVVTGANDYFILSNDFVKSKRIKNYVEPIISKSAYVKGVFILDSENFKDISDKFKKVNLMNLNNIKEYKLPKSIKQYIKKGEYDNINKRFKCAKRKPWYSLPKDLIGDIVFFKRYDNIPRVIVNEIKCHTTDIGYNIKLNEGYDDRSVAFCFYNSLTLCLCEYHGRFYGGGVAELTPNELRKVYIPYKYIEEFHINRLNKMIKENADIDVILNYVDEIVFEGIADIEQINILKDIRKRYIKRRKSNIK